VANKARGVAFLIISAVIISFLIYQVQSYMTEQQEIKDSFKLANEKLLSAQEHFENAKSSADTATEAFNALK
jgi:hypothetical protein